MWGRVGAAVVFLVTSQLLRPAGAAAAVTDTTISDVTTRSFSVVWSSDAPVSDARVYVFADPDGATLLYPSLPAYAAYPSITATLNSASVPQAHALGIVKLTVSGLPADTPVYIQTETRPTSGPPEVFPLSPPYLEVRTAVATMPVTAAAHPIVNDVVEHPVFAADGVTPAAGALVLVDIPGLTTAPQSAFVGEAASAPSALVDLSNTFDAAGVTAQVPDEAILRITEYRGGLCAGLTDHRLVRFRRLPAPLPGPTVTEAVVPLPCFPADPVCDDVVNVLDLQWALNHLGRIKGECGFHPDMDLVADFTIDMSDVRSILERFGESAPFEP